MTTDQTIEQEIQDKGLTAPRVTPDDIDANIKHVEYVKHVSQGGQVLRWAVITTGSGYAVVGNPSVAVSPANDNEEIGQKVAFDNSKNEIWPLMGYELKQRLHQSANPDQSPDSPEKKNYTLNDIEAYATAFMERMHQYEFRIRTKDGLKYEGFIQKGTALEMKINALEECNRQRNNA